MKKFLFLLCAICMCGAFALTACDDSETPPPADPPATEYTVTYADGMDDKEINVPTDSAKYTAGATVTVKEAISTDGYTFQGWNDGTTAYQPAQTFTMPAHDVTLTAQWEPASQNPLVGVWAGTSGESPTSLYIAESDGKLYFVMVVNQEGENSYSGGIATEAETEGEYLFSLGSLIAPASPEPQEITFTLTLDGEALTGNFMGAMQFAKTQDQTLPPPLQMNGTYSGTFESYITSIDFDAKTWDNEEADFVAVGDFILIASKTAQEYLVVFKAEVEVDGGNEADKYYFSNFKYMQGYYAELTPQA